jgi:hypothetical protein
MELVAVPITISIFFTTVYVLEKSVCSDAPSDLRVTPRKLRHGRLGELVMRTFWNIPASEQSFFFVIMLHGYVIGRVIIGSTV